MIDTPEKRCSAMRSRRLPWSRRFTPLPGGGVAQGDRQQVAAVYRGIVSRTPQLIFGDVTAVHPSDDPTKLVFEVHWSFTVPVVTPVGVMTEGAQNIEVSVGLTDAQITLELRQKLADLLSETTGLVFLMEDVRSCSV